MFAVRGKDTVGEIPLVTEQKKGQLWSRSVVPQAPRNQPTAVGGISLLGIMIILGIILWVAGGASGDAEMVFCGKLLFGLGIGLQCCTYAIVCGFCAGLTLRLTCCRGL